MKSSRQGALSGKEDLAVGLHQHIGRLVGAAVVDRLLAVTVEARVEVAGGGHRDGGAQRQHSGGGDQRPDSNDTTPATTVHRPSSLRSG